MVHKPGSVVDSHLSRTAHYCASQAICTRRSAGSLVPPYSILLQTGFARHDGRPPSGELLPRPFTLTRCGNRAVCSLLHFPVACANWTLSSVLPCGARTFLSRSRGSDYQNHSEWTVYHRLPHTSRAKGDCLKRVYRL